jgi:predicted phage replisome organizer
MPEKKYYWIKLKPTFFTSKEIKKLRRIAGGDTYVVVYLKMQLLSLETGGKLYYDGVEDDFAEELALTLDEDTDNVKMTIAFLTKYGLLEQVKEDEFFMPEVPINTGKEGASAQRVRKHRELQCNEKALQCNTDVTKCNTEIEKEKEKDIEIEIEIERDNSADKPQSPFSYQQIVSMFHQICVSYPKVTKLSDKRKKAISARLKTYTIDEIKSAFEKAERSSFLKGRNNRNWSANFDWIMSDGNLAKILDGNYDNRENKATVQSQSAASFAPQPTTDDNYGGYIEFDPWAEMGE